MKNYDDCIIITFTDINYLDIFNIFYDYFKKLKLDNLLVVSLDEETYTNLNNRGIKTILKTYKINNKNKFWEFRLNIINEIFKSNKKNIIHTDSDCFWLKNILEVINKISFNYDIIGSIGFGHPPKIIKQIGFSLCCGLYFIKYSQLTMNIIDNILNSESNSTDDQVLFNNYIFDNKQTIVDNTCNNIIYKDIILNNDLKIGIIKDAIVSRRYKPNLYCFHPFLGNKNVQSKILQIKNHI